MNETCPGSGKSVYKSGSLLVGRTKIGTALYRCPDCGNGYVATMTRGKFHFRKHTREVQDAKG